MSAKWSSTSYALCLSTSCRRSRAAMHLAFLAAPAAPCKMSQASPRSPRPPRRPQRPQRPRTHARRIAKFAARGDVVAMDRAAAAAVAEGFELSAINYTVLAHGYVVAGDAEGCFSVLDRMRRLGVPPTNVTVRVAVKACGVRGKGGSARMMRGVLDWFGGCGAEAAEVRTWNMAIGAIGRAGGVGAMVEALFGMVDRGAVGGRVPLPDAYSFNICIAALGRARMPHLAFALFGRMIAARRVTGAAPDVVTYNCLLEAAASANVFPVPSSGAAASVEDVVEGPQCFVEAVVASMERHMVRPDLTTETLFLRLLSRKTPFEFDNTAAIRYAVWARWRLACETDSNVQAQLDQKYYNTALNAFAHIGDLRGVSEVFLDMQRRHVHLDMYTINAILSAASRAGDVSLARSTLAAIRSSSLSADMYSYTAAIAACARCTPRDPDTARMLLDEAIADGVPWTAAMVNAALSTHGSDVDSAVTFWKALRACPDEASRAAVSDKMVYDALMRVSGAAGRPDMALRIVYAATKAQHLHGSGETRLFNAFQRGMRESGCEQRVVDNVLKWQYLQHLRVKCGAFERVDYPIERIRIRY